MNRIIKPLSAILVIIMLMLTLCSCQDNSWALKVGDRVVSAEQYKTSAISIKSQFLTDNGLEESDSLWDQYIDTSYSATTQEYLDAMIQSYFISYNLYAYHFDELGLTLDPEVEKEIKDQIQIQIEELKNQITDTRMEIRSQARRLDGIWWKIGLLAGIVSIIMTEIYGNGVGSIVSDLMGWWPL